MRVIAIANHKGGSGKTTTVFYLARQFASMGRRVLCVDLDDQGTLSRNRCEVVTHGKPTIAEVLDGMADANDVRLIGAHGVEVVPADYRLAWMGAKLQVMSPNHTFLAEALDGLAGFDVVLLDCPPSAGVLLINALAAATGVIVPCAPSVESWDGYQRMVGMIDDVRRKLQHTQLQLLGTVVTQAVSASKTHWLYRQMHEDTGHCLGAVLQRTGLDADADLLHQYAGIAERVIADVG